MASTQDTSPGAMAAQQSSIHQEAAAVAAAAAAAQQLQQASPTSQHAQLHQHQHQHPHQHQHQHQAHQAHQHAHQALQQQQQQPMAQQQPMQQSPMQQHGSPQPQAAGHPQVAQSSAFDSLSCQWVGCSERCSSAEALYEHVCERHVGRKSTNNLNLTCGWALCTITTVKRDHITSHIRVHVPLKPHKCDFCGKAFKRPQDLKKHVKTHADDSVLLRSPVTSNMPENRANTSGFQGPSGKPASAYYPGHDLGNPGAYPHPGHLGNNNFYQNPQQPYAGYGQVNYPASNSLADLQSMDTRRRAIEALNDFLGDIKRRAIDPGNYYDVGQRLQSQNLPLPVSSGYGYSSGGNYDNNSSYNSANSILESFGGSGGAMSLNGGGAGAMTHAPLGQSYSLPLPNARTKTDLQDIDRFLEQLQSTVYENSTSAALAGVQQPGVHTQYAQYPGFGNHYRHSNSPPNMQQSASASSASTGLGSLSSVASVPSSALETPALTPASVSSYASAGHSPMSTHSRSSMSSVNGSMYPSLPSVAAVSDMGHGYPATTSAPPSGLASGFDGFEGRRYSGGRLQREAPAPRSRQDADSDAMDTESDGQKTPRASAKHHDIADASSLDPALRSTPQPSSTIHSPATGSSGEPADDKAQETWVENIRVIEALRKWIHERLTNNDFDHDSQDGSKQPEHFEAHDPQLEQHQHQPHPDQHLQHPDHMDHQSEQEQQPAGEVDAGVAYPVLKVGSA